MATYRENMEQYFNSKEDIEALVNWVDVLSTSIEMFPKEEDIMALREKKAELFSAEGYHRAVWLCEIFKTFPFPELGIIAEAASENGKTQSVFGEDMEVLFKDKTLIIDNSYFIPFDDGKVELFDNGCVKFLYEGETHYINIKRWNNFMERTMK